MRTKLGALLGAAGMILFAASVTMAAPGGTPGKPTDSPGGGPPASHGGGGQPSNDPGPPSDNPGGGGGGGGGGQPTSDPGGGGGGSPTYEIDVTKEADPANVGPSGGTVEFTVFVTATGTGFFQVVNIDDPLPGCTLGAAVEEEGDGDTKLEEGETWSYSCSVDDVEAGTENVATVHACHNVSACNHEAHDAEAVGSVTVGEGADPSVTPTSSPNPTFDSGGVTECPCDTAPVVGVAGSDRSFMLVISLGLLLASLVLVTPSRPIRARVRER
jgi:hypothetical protein